MCGIAGMLSFHGQQADQSVLERMVRTLAHRGPDDSGAVVCGPCGLANTRLAVIDLSAAGHQPMHVVHPAGDTWIAYNGEVYNFGSVRASLEESGHRFFSHSDTETLLRSYIQHGAPAFIQPFRGMFALAIWDARRRRLVLARDRLGEKPLYYWQDTGWLVFGSEIKALLQHPAVTARLNRSLIPHYLAYGYAPAPDTLFEGIHQLSPGMLLTADLGDGSAKVSIKPFWEAPYPVVDAAVDEEEITSGLLNQLREAVQMRMLADVPLGAFLSGGLDSAAVVALMAQASSHAVRTFSIGFEDEPSFDETPYARQVAAQFATEHHEFIVRPDVLNLVGELVWHHDQPFGDSSAIPTYLVSKLARQHVTVALTGDGGDELFAGYDRFRAAQLSRLYERIPRPLQHAVAHTLDRLPETTHYRGLIRRAGRFAQTVGLEMPERYLSWVRYVPSRWVVALVGAGSEKAVQGHYRTYFTSHNDRHADEAVAQLLDVNLKTYLPEDLLVKVDRCSMAVSLEARAPFLDHILFEYAARIPLRLKLRHGVKKYILKRALRGLLPEGIIHRQKHGFGVPVGSWFRGELAAFARQTLLSPAAAGRGILQIQSVRAMLDAHQQGRSDLGQALWALLTFELWMQRYFT